MDTTKFDTNYQRLLDAETHLEKALTLLRNSESISNYEIDEVRDRIRGLVASLVVVEFSE